MMINPEKCTQKIREKASAFAAAKSDRVYTEKFEASKKALLMKDAMVRGIESVAAQEREAKANPEYLECIKGLAVAVEIEETLKWELEAERLDVEIWRTQQANERMILKSHE